MHFSMHLRSFYISKTTTYRTMTEHVFFVFFLNSFAFPHFSMLYAPTRLCCFNVNPILFFPSLLLRCQAFIASATAVFAFPCLGTTLPLFHIGTTYLIKLSLRLPMFLFTVNTPQSFKSLIHYVINNLFDSSFTFVVMS